MSSVNCMQAELLAQPPEITDIVCVKDAMLEVEQLLLAMQVPCRLRRRRRRFECHCIL